MFSEDMLDHVLVDTDPECSGGLLSDSATAKVSVALPSLAMAWMSTRDGTLGPGFAFLLAEYSSRYQE
jgi:hypothetical protein